MSPPRKEWPPQDRNNPLTLLFSFRGRVGRRAFWLNWLIWTGMVFVAALIDPALAGFVVLASIWPHAAMAAKRLHDLGNSGWFALGIILPAFNLLLLLYMGIWPGKSE